MTSRSPATAAGPAAAAMLLLLPLLLPLLVTLLATPVESARPARNYLLAEHSGGRFGSPRLPRASSTAINGEACHNQGEKLVTQTLAFETELTTSATQFAYYHYNLELDDGRPVTDTVFLTGISVHVDKVDHLHHVLIYGCDRAMRDAELEPTIFSEPGKHLESWAGGCETPVYGWNYGHEDTTFPCNLAFPLGPGAKFPALEVQVHYNNPKGAAGIVDSSAVTLHLSTTPREHLLGVLVLGDLMLRRTPTEGIPPGQRSWGLTHRCLIQTEAPLTLYTQFLHMHHRGRRMWSETIAAGGAPGADGKWEFAERAQPGGPPLATLGRTDALTYSHQPWISGNGTVLRNGDLVTTTCVWNTEGEAGTVRGGVGTDDEMCMHFMLVYPGEGLTQHTCEGSPYDMSAVGEWPAEKSYVSERPELLEAMLEPNDRDPLGYDNLQRSLAAKPAPQRTGDHLLQRAAQQSHHLLPRTAQHLHEGGRHQAQGLAKYGLYSWLSHPEKRSDRP